LIENKNILFIANGGKEWIGGLYYVKNIIYTLFKNDMISSSVNIYILVKKENTDLFRSFLKYENVIILQYNNIFFNKFIKKISGKIFDKILDLELLHKMKILKVDYIYPVNSYPYLFLENKCIFWIPDFQHIHLPEMFSKKEIRLRNKAFKYIAENHKYLILSSKDSFNDYKSLYPKRINGVEILSFQSDIEDEIKDIDNKFIIDTIKKYNLPSKFIFLPNQFWKHKNHIIAFKAVNYVVNKNKINICLVCTGNTTDYRNQEHFNNLKKYIEDNNLEKNIRILGFISRKDQLALMKASIAVLQPSLFEGWGTVVEDAKALNKRIIMSDIDVHYEQKNDNCIIFKKNSYIALGNIILNLN